MAQTTKERQALLREINQAVVEQVRAGHARPWATGKPDDEERTFVCECGNPDCDVFVEQTVRAYESGGAQPEP